MKIALCIPVLNRYDTLAKAVESAFAGSRKPDGLLIVDNGGKLDIDAYARYTPIYNVVEPGTNIGCARSWNAFYKLTGTEWQPLITNDDVEFYPDTIGVLERDILLHPFVYPGSVNKEGNVMNAFSMFMLRRNIFAEIGEFDETFWPAYFEDNDYALRLTRKGYTLHASDCSYGHVGSATRASLLPGELDQHHHYFRVARSWYKRKWGGLPGSEVFTTPYNGESKERVANSLIIE